MKTNSVIKALSVASLIGVVAAFVGFASTCSASSIAWGSASTISGDSDVSTDGRDAGQSSFF